MLSKALVKTACFTGERIGACAFSSRPPVHGATPRTETYAIPVQIDRRADSSGASQPRPGGASPRPPRRRVHAGTGDMGADICDRISRTPSAGFFARRSRRRGTRHYESRSDALDAFDRLVGQRDGADLVRGL